MDKPFSMLYEEFKQGLANLINNSALPPFVIESLMKNYIYEINSLAKSQYQSDKAQYENFLFEKEKTEKKEKKDEKK